MKFLYAHISLGNSPVSIQVNFPRFLLFFISLFKRLAQLAMLILVINLFAHWTSQYFMESAQKQKSRLYSKLQNIDVRIDSLDIKISKFYKNEDLLYVKYGLVVPDTSMREMGFGGLIPPESLLVRSATPIKKLQAAITDRFQKIDTKIDRLSNSYLSLQLYIERLHGNLQHTPSIAPVISFFLSSPFGPRTHPVTGETEKMHMGIDMTAPKWTTIYAPANGRIDLVSTSETMGRYVSIDHGNGIVTRYGHMEKPFVKEGQMVKRFDVIGYVGNTGRTTGHHLHYEVWVNGVAVNPIYYILPEQYSVE